MRLIYFTDIHLCEGQESVAGFEQCLEAMLVQEPTLLINGGDLGVASEALDTYDRMLRDVQQPVHLCPGNHEICSGYLPIDRAGQSSYSFDAEGVHLVMLDVVRYYEPDEQHPWNWYAETDDQQLQWLEADLQTVAPSTPVILISHVPLSTSYPMRRGIRPQGQYPTNHVINADRVIQMLQRFEHAATLHGHDHENCRHRAGGVQVLTTGAVAGRWWRDGLQTRNLNDEPLGFRVIDVDAATGRITSCYVPFIEADDRPAAIYRDEASGRRFVNVFDGSPQTKVVVADVGSIPPLNPWHESSRQLSPHMYELPEAYDSLMVEVEIQSEDGFIWRGPLEPVR